MLFPRIVNQVRFRRGGVSDAIRGRGAVEGAVNAIAIAIGSECVELPVKIDRIPKERVVQIFALDSSDQALDERVRRRDVRDRFDFFNLEDP